MAEALRKIEDSRDETGHITCPFCWGMNVAQVQNQEQVIPCGPEEGPTKGNVFRVTVVVPVWTCLLEECGQSWTDWVAENIRERALNDVIDWDKVDDYQGY